MLQQHFHNIVVALVRRGMKSSQQILVLVVEIGALPDIFIVNYENNIVVVVASASGSGMALSPFII